MAWIWDRLAETAPIRPLAREPPYAAEAAIETAKRKKKKKKKREREKKIKKRKKKKKKKLL